MPAGPVTSREAAPPLTSGSLTAMTSNPCICSDICIVYLPITPMKPQAPGVCYIEVTHTYVYIYAYIYTCICILSYPGIFNPSMQDGRKCSQKLLHIPYRHVYMSMIKHEKLPSLANVLQITISMRFPKKHEARFFSLYTYLSGICIRIAWVMEISMSKERLGQIQINIYIHTYVYVCVHI